MYKVKKYKREQPGALTKCCVATQVSKTSSNTEWYLKNEVLFLWRAHAGIWDMICLLFQEEALV